MRPQQQHFLRRHVASAARARSSIHHRLQTAGGIDTPSPPSTSPTPPISVRPENNFRFLFNIRRKQGMLFLIRQYSQPVQPQRGDKRHRNRPGFFLSVGERNSATSRRGGFSGSLQAHEQDHTRFPRT